MKFIDLFAGIGGFRYGLEAVYNTKTGGQGQEESVSIRGSGNAVSKPNVRQHPFSCVYANEWDKYAASIYRKHYGEIDTRNIKTVKADELPDHDLLCAGFPCQAFSVAGKRRGFDDTRGTLFFDIARIASEKRPRYLLLENVKGLLSHDKGKTFQRILGVLSDLGYRVEWQILNSKHFGVPQNRERVFIIGHLRGECGRKVFPITRKDGRTLRELTKGESQGMRVYEPELSTTLASEAGGLGAKTGLYAVKPVLTPDRKNKRQNGRRFKNDGDPSFTLTGQDRHGVAISRGEIKQKKQSNCLDANYYKGLDNHQARTGVMENMKIRRLTPTECERLQAFPDGWTEKGIDENGNQVEISDTQRYKCLGNAVTTSVITAIGTKLTKEEKNE